MYARLYEHGEMLVAAFGSGIRRSWMSSPRRGVVVHRDGPEGELVEISVVPSERGSLMAALVQAEDPEGVLELVSVAPVS